MAIAVNFDRPCKEPRPVKVRSYKVSNIHVYKGALLAVHRGTGYAVNAANATHNQVIGVALAECDNSGGSVGDLSVQVGRGTYLFSKTSAAVTDVGCLATAVDNDTVDVGGSEVVNVGRVVGFLSTTHLWVDMNDDSINSHDA